MRVLVSVASRHGATAEMGALVAQVLREHGHTVDELPPDDVEDVGPWEAVVLGSAVYVGRLAVALRHLVERQGPQLRARRVHLFWSGPLQDPARGGVDEPDDVGVVARRVGAEDVRCFAGRLDHERLSLSERALVALVRSPDGDFRDLAAVRAWAQDVAGDLAGRPARV
ncbi:flavodoxin domain-containing protein [Cellulomonas marina]|uniref:Menaquinone-dependent protoporphyrinogen oxidase n=1 Tax=Cellulomonas marina TaxID=988821 RepID=A0A1I0VZ09_9CELL|nr:flavodoxin domain-containing protein [Cellulomonas marina]GIG27454.1 flavodoxin [Cellulomonas marina]SFA81591.1 menaquinone-dependent protoporphyrinogen oxidase [Cellulomonas marina]